MTTWCVVQFSSGATEIVPNSWVEGDKVFWPPYPPKDSIRLNAAILNREQPGQGWHTYQPIRLLITRDSHDEAARSLDRYLNKDCDTTDIQSEEESHHALKRKRRPNPVYHSDEEPQNERRFTQAPKVLFPATQLASQNSQPSPPPRIYQTLQRPNSPMLSYPNVPASFPGDELVFSPMNLLQRPSPEVVSDSSETARLALKDVAMQKLLTAVTELSKEVKDLREEFRQFRQSCRCGQSESVVQPLSEPLELPFHTMEALDHAEETLLNGTNRQAMTARLATIGGTTLEVRVRRMMAHLLSNELASRLNWAGKKNKEPTKQKRPFKELALCRSLFDALTQQMGTATVTQFAFAQGVQKWQRYAPDRAGGTGRQLTQASDDNEV
uniref:DUF4806 domain-containing protein n=1 Tax=Cyprinus carpio carpio TaxID=630221 RepID=A0A9J7WX61_CYPCA